MKQKVLLTRPSQTETAIELFPDGNKVFADYSPELASRVLPVASFDAKVINEEPGPCVFLYYEDPAVDFLEWQTDGRLITHLKQAKEIRPFSEKPDTKKIIEQLGGSHLSPETYEIDTELPSAYKPERWAEVFENKMLEAGAIDIFNCLRIGGGYPCFVQGQQPSDGPGFMAELPALYYELASIDLYLFKFGREFQQMMQMT